LKENLELDVLSTKKKDDVGPLTLTSNYDSCGIKVAEDGKGNVVYSQAVNITYGSSNKFIKRHEHALRFEVSCVKPSSNKIALAGAGHFNVSSLKEQSIAKSEATEFDITLTKQTDNTYASQDLAAQSKLGDQMYFKLEMNTVVDNLKMAPTTCYASNAKDSKDTYPLIQNGCPNAEDGTVKIDETNNKKTFTWSAEAFKFFGPSDAVYVTCDVVVCEENNKAAACQRCDTGAPPRRRRALALSMASKIRTASISSSIFSIA